MDLPLYGVPAGAARGAVVASCPAGLPDLAALLDGYRPAIQRYFLGKGCTVEEAEDLTQETLLRAYRYLPTVRGDRLATWLYRIASSIFVSSLRKRRFHTLSLESVVVEPAAPQRPEPERDVRIEQLEGIVRELPEQYQHVLRLRFYEDRSLAEIAGIMECTPAAAKLRVFRAVSALRKRCLPVPASR